MYHLKDNFFEIDDKFKNEEKENCCGVKLFEIFQKNLMTMKKKRSLKIKIKVKRLEYLWANV